MARLWCRWFGHRWSMWSNAGAIYRMQFRWCKRCDVSEVKQARRRGDL
jgi:hypothetical protein